MFLLSRMSKIHPPLGVFLHTHCKYKCKYLCKYLGSNCVGPEVTPACEGGNDTVQWEWIMGLSFVLRYNRESLLQLQWGGPRRRVPGFAYSSAIWLAVKDVQCHLTSFLLRKVCVVNEYLQMDTIKKLNVIYCCSLIPFVTSFMLYQEISWHWPSGTQNTSMFLFPFFQFKG